MKRAGGKRFWSASRRAFRWMRICAWSVVLLIALALVYLNEVGLPDFVKRRVVAALEAEGLHLEFSRLRLKGYRRLVIDQIRLGMTNSAAPIRFTASQAELGFENQALKSMEFKLDAIDLSGGHLEILLQDANAPNRSLQIENIKAQVRRQFGDRWQLESFRGESLGARWQLSGAVTNIFALAESAARDPSKSVDWPRDLRNLLDTLDRIQFASPPQISVNMLGDLNELSQFKATASVRSEHAKTPWGEVSELFFQSALLPSDPPGASMQATLDLRLAQATAPWGGLRDVSIVARATYPLTNSAKFESDWQLRSPEVSGKWFAGRNVQVSLNTTNTASTNLLTVVQASSINGKIPGGQAAHADFKARLEHAYPLQALNSFLVSLLPVKPAVSIPEVPEGEILKLGQHWVGDWNLDFQDLHTSRGDASKLSFAGDVRERPDRVPADASWGFWQSIASMLINWRAESTDFIIPEAKIDKIAAHGRWQAPQFTVESLDSQLYNGSFHLDAMLDVATRRVDGKAKLDFDIKKTASLFDPGVRGFLDQFEWAKPPRFEARLSLTTPPWTNSPANTMREVLQSTVLDGSVAIGAASFRDVSCTEFTTHFYLTNFHWGLPDIVLKRDEGQLNIAFEGHAFETPFRLEIHGGIDPWAALPLLNDNARQGLKFVRFPEPPRIDGVLTGDLQDNEKLYFAGNLAASNAVVRQEPFLDFKTAVIYSNLWIYLTDPIAHRTTNEVLSAPWAAIDIERGLMHVTNGFSTTDPYKFTKIIGPMTFKAIEPYIFKIPPTVRAAGIIPLRDPDDADIQFQIAGEDFAYWRFNMSKVTCGVHWHGDFLEVTNVQAKFYGGNLDWEGHFNFLKDDTANYRFKGVTTNVDLSLLLSDILTNPPAKLDGTLNGTLVITDANSTNLNTWIGHGEAELKEGFLWDIPVFGIFSKPLDTIVPGFGKSRVSSGAGTFQIAGGKIFTKDMEVRAPAFRLKYDGTLDYDGMLDAKVEAQMFRDAWIFGRAMSAVFWPLAKAFEAKVSGHLSAPKSELAHIPKIILFPLRPIQTLKELGPKDKEKEKGPEKQP